MRTSTYICSMDPVQSSLGMHERNPTIRNTITGNEGKHTRGPTVKRKNSPQELCRSNRAGNVGVNVIFDDDLLLFSVSVNLYHRTQSVSGLQSR